MTLCITLHHLRQHIMQELGAHTPLTALISGIFDYVPSATIFPYFTIEQENAQDISGQSLPLYEANYLLHLWTQGSSQRDIMSIIQIIDERLTQTVLSSSSLHLVAWKHESMNQRILPDTVTKRTTMQYRAQCQPVSLT